MFGKSKGGYKEKKRKENIFNLNMCFYLKTSDKIQLFVKGIGKIEGLFGKNF